MIIFFQLQAVQFCVASVQELPNSFVEKHGRNFSSYATFKVPTGEESQIEIKMYKDQAWLHKGWPEFIVKYSIKPKYSLLFRYKGRSRFSVRIFGYNYLEIEYPSSSANSSELLEVKEEDDGDVEILDVHPQKIQRVREIENGNINRSNARDRVMEKAKAYHSPNPHFIVMLRPSCMASLNIQAEFGRNYFGGMDGNNRVRLIGEDGRAWSIDYIVGSPPRNRVRLCSRWPIFLKESRLQEGDVCLFELVNSSNLTFKAIPFRVAELGEEPTNKDSMLITATRVAASCENKRVLSFIDSTVRERVENFKSNKPHFIVHVTSYMLSSTPKVTISAAHSRRYLVNEKSITILHESNGKKWVVYLNSNSTTLSISLYKGWKDFASANQLQIGDVLVLEMMNDKPKAYKANIFRIAS